MALLMLFCFSGMAEQEETQTADAEETILLPDVDCSDGWMAQTTEWITLEGDFELTYTFDYAGFLSPLEFDWHNMVVEFTAGDNWLTIVLNGDGWTVGEVWLKPENGFAVEDGVDVKALLMDAQATVEFKREGQLITIQGVFEKDGNAGVWTASTDDPSLPEVLNFHIGGEFCRLTNIQMKGI